MNHLHFYFWGSNMLHPFVWLKYVQKLKKKKKKWKACYVFFFFFSALKLKTKIQISPCEAFSQPIAKMTVITFTNSCFTCSLYVLSTTTDPDMTWLLHLFCLTCEQWQVWDPLLYTVVHLHEGRPGHKPWFQQCDITHSSLRRCPSENQSENPVNRDTSEISAWKLAMRLHRRHWRGDATLNRRRHLSEAQCSDASGIYHVDSNKT